MIRKTLLALAALTLAGAAQAATYNIAGSFDGNPATVLTGSFSFDDAEVAAGGFDGLFNLSALNVQFQGETFTLGEAFDANVSFEFGTLTGPNAVFTSAAGGTLALYSFFGASNFAYSLASVDTGGELSISAVPEPESWALALGGLAAMGLMARRRKAA